MTRQGWTAVVTAAGQATRFRPFSAFVPKEMLPLGDTPALGHVISECAGAGASRIVVATRPGTPSSRPMSSTCGGTNNRSKR